MPEGFLLNTWKFLFFHKNKGIFHNHIKSYNCHLHMSFITNEKFSIGGDFTFSPGKLH
jgi:hypothetical protein